MRITTQIILLYLCFNFQLNAQVNDSIVLKNEVYIEIGGPSVLASLNYNRNFILQEKIFLSLHLGIGAFHLKDFTNKFNPDITLPIGIDFNYIFSSYSNGHFSASIGGGNTFTSIVILSNNFTPVRAIENSGFLKIGANWHFKKHFYIGLAYTPIFEKYKTLRHWGGLSIGYAF